jgi:hypothetical protein
VHLARDAGVLLATVLAASARCSRADWSARSRLSRSAYPTATGAIPVTMSSARAAALAGWVATMLWIMSHPTDTTSMTTGQAP